MKQSGTIDNIKSINELEARLLAIDKIGATIIIKNETEKSSPFTCIENIVVPALQNIGLKWEIGKASLSQVYMSGKICENIIDSIIIDHGGLPEHSSRLGMAVLEDHHTLGKRIVISILKSGGHSVKDYGHGLTVNQLAKKVLDDDIDILLISTLMLPAALRTREAIKIIKKERPDIRIIVGGAPYLFDDKLWKDVGADACGHTASESLLIVNSMLKEAI